MSEQIVLADGEAAEIAAYLIKEVLTLPLGLARTAISLAGVDTDAITKADIHEFVESTVEGLVWAINKTRSASEAEDAVGTIRLAPDGRVAIRTRQEYCDWTLISLDGGYGDAAPQSFVADWPVIFRPGDTDE